ncbi:hypothetical protein HHL28_04400 [Aerophototrophica crusticola]|uniref:Uncharacterized protein n=1 Tax=Aerophototrophica crusticola TaxID=1709002 RepID=A0A858R4V9_9PROT|nr:hypothetical protein HHL28_04400 [Rhodospirillaceae bacterium B3]
MAAISLDDLVLRLQTAAGLAQDALSASERGRVVRNLQLNGNSDVEAETWSLKVEIPGRGGQPARTVQIPFASLHTLTETRVTELRIETTAVVEEVPAPQPPRRPGMLAPPPDLRLRIGVPPRAASKLHKLVVTIFGPRFEQAEVRLNDRLLRVFGIKPAGRADGAAPPAEE